MKNFLYSGGRDHHAIRERGGSVVERLTTEPDVGGSKPTSAVLCP